MFVGALDVRPSRWGPKTLNRPSNPSHSCALPPQLTMRSHHHGTLRTIRVALNPSSATTFFLIYTRVSGGMFCYVVPNPSTFGRFAGIFVSALLRPGQVHITGVTCMATPYPRPTEPDDSSPDTRPYNVTSIGLVIFGFPLEGTRKINGNLAIDRLFL